MSCQGQPKLNLLMRHWTEDKQFKSIDKSDRKKYNKPWFQQ